VLLLLGAAVAGPLELAGADLGIILCEFKKGLKGVRVL
jgi:hypothetical protein